MPWHGNAINQVSNAGAVAALDDDDFVKMYLEKNDASRNLLYSFLENSGVEYYKSHANCSYFSLDKFPKDFVEIMMKKKIQVRKIDDYGKMYCRVSTGKPEEMEVFINAMKAI